jgi:hypothetical protein
MRLLLLGCLLLPLLLHAAPVPVIFDTDMDSDCDDVAALAMLHTLADRGEARILGTMVSSKHPWSAACTDAINTFYGRPDLPLGVPQGKGAIEQGSKFAQRVSEEFPHDTPPVNQVPEAATLYRRLLSAEPDGSVTIVTIGDLTNIRYLLESRADAASQLDGPALVRAKVKVWVCMGTRYPSDLDPRKWGNFKPDAESTALAIANWPVLITFTGGQEFAESLAFGSRFSTLPARNPVRRAYELYFGGQAKNRHAADPIAVMVAVRGPGEPWKLVREGYNHIFPNGTHEWRESPDNPLHEYISALVRPTEKEVTAVMEELVLGNKAAEKTRGQPDPGMGTEAPDQQLKRSGGKRG